MKQKFDELGEEWVGENAYKVDNKADRFLFSLKPIWTIFTPWNASRS
jgi:hypothetical protein